MLKILLYSSFLIYGIMLSAQSASPLYSFFLAGHVYGKSGINNIGVHPPFKAKFDFIKSSPEIEFGVFLGDIAGNNPIEQDWIEVDADVDTLGLTVHYTAGNHDMRDRPLFEARYGSTYYEFSHENDLFIVLDPNLDEWNISGDQLLFLTNTIESKINEVDNLFILLHQLIWRTSDNQYAGVKPNSDQGMAEDVNFWTELVPLFTELPIDVYLCAGDVGAASWSSDFMYDTFDNITLIATGMGEGIGDNFIVVNVDELKEVEFELICLNTPEPDCFGDITDYHLSETNMFTESPFDCKKYPIPFSDELSIEFEIAGRTVIEVISPSGTILFNKLFPESRKIELDLGELSAGIYYLLIERDSFTEVSTIVKN